MSSSTVGHVTRVPHMFLQPAHVPQDPNHFMEGVLPVRECPKPIAIVLEESPVAAVSPICVVVDIAVVHVVWRILEIILVCCTHLEEPGVGMCVQLFHGSFIRFGFSMYRSKFSVFIVPF
jgi:hypothetical protein